jgi:hypothetical protein
MPNAVALKQLRNFGERDYGAGAPSGLIEFVVPAQAGTQESAARAFEVWIPACAGMTKKLWALNR